MNKIKVFTDGGSRGNPGEAALGVYIEDEFGKELFSYGKRLGVATNNFAEYSAIIAAFDWLINNKNILTNDCQINFYMDSLLAKSQLNGEFKVKNSTIRELIFEIRKKEQELGLNIYYLHIPREENKKADAMVNRALDNLI